MPKRSFPSLVEQGIVIEHRFGKRHAYEANREHLLWPSVEGLFVRAASFACECRMWSRDG